MHRRDVLFFALAAADLLRSPALRGSTSRDEDLLGFGSRDADPRGSFLVPSSDSRAPSPEPRVSSVESQAPSPESGVPRSEQRSVAHASVLQPAAIAAGDGELVYVGRDPVRIKLSPGGSSGRFAMITQEVSPGTTIPVHLHENEDELIFIQSGTGEGTLAEATVPLAAGSALFVPKGTWHGGRNTGSGTLMWIAIYSPSGFDGYFREIGRKAPTDPPRARSQDERVALDRQYGIRYRG
jgi:mannose-6-phosphate isomerase-like protein (cupin superfamily)